MIWQTGICLYSCFSLSAVIEGNTKRTTLADTTSQKTMYQGISIKPCWATHSSQNCYQIFPVERATSCLQHEQGLRSPLQPGLPGEMEILQWIRHAWSSLYSLKCLLQGVFSWSWEALLIVVSSLLSIKFLKFLFKFRWKTLKLYTPGAEDTRGMDDQLHINCSRKTAITIILYEDILSP